jgi:chromosome segregation protein
VQREPLQKEAETAKRYKQKQADLRGVEQGLLVTEVAEAIAEIEAQRKRAEEAVGFAEKEVERSRELEGEAEKLEERCRELEAKAEQLRHEEHVARADADRAVASHQVAESRLHSLDEIESNIKQETRMAAEQVRLAEADLEKAKKREEAEVATLEKLRDMVGGADGETKQVAQELERREKTLKEARQANEAWQRLEAESAERKRRLQEAQQELSGVQSALPDLDKAIEEAAERHKKAQEELETKREQGRELNKKRQDLHAFQEQVEVKRRKVLGEIAALNGRRQGIEATIEAHEGLAQGPRAVLALVEQGALRGDYQPVAEAIDVQADHATAIATALGAAANDLIVPDEDHARRAIRELKEKRLGRATFQPVPLMRPHHVSQELEQLLRRPGVIGLGSELVDCEAAHRPVIESLLGRTLVVETLDAGLALAKTRGWNKIVSLDGELVHASGAVTGGTQRSQTDSLLKRKSELKDLENRIRQLQDEVDASAKGDDQRQQADADLKAQLEALSNELEKLQEPVDEAKDWLRGLQHERDETAKSGQKLEGEIARLSEEPERPEIDISVEEAEKQRDETLKVLAAKSADAERTLERLKDAEGRVAESKQLREEADRRAERARQQRESRHRRAENIEPEREELKKRLSDSLTEKSSAELRGKKAKEEAERVRQEKEALLAEAKGKKEEARKAQDAAGSSSDIAHKAELARARADSKRATAAERLMDEYGLTEAEAQDMAPEADVPEDAAQLVSCLRRELKAMGDVNLGAIEAYERLTERYDELTAQREDILSGKGEILSSIRELDRLTRERFETTFAKLQETFSETFQRVFGGGEGRLLLADEEDALDAGVEIEVTIPGKRKQRLDLLSGGERAMSATAFLFSLLKVKSSPLVVLDELDAPLDGRNVERFIHLLNDFRGQSQFVLITHNPVTIEAAEVWFGVTMQEPGVSTVVPCKVPDKGLVKAVVPDAYLKG